MNKVSRGLFMIMVGIGAVSPILCAGSPNNSAGAVFVMTNAADKNQVIAFERAGNGTLGESISYGTQGRGSGGTTDHSNPRVHSLLARTILFFLL
jgi:6-phosphogluconolactonase